jgi:hypothetical protein
MSVFCFFNILFISLFFLKNQKIIIRGHHPVFTHSAFRNCWLSSLLLENSGEFGAGVFSFTQIHCTKVQILNLTVFAQITNIFISQNGFTVSFPHRVYSSKHLWV